MPTAETPTTPAVAPTVAGTSQDNTYQAPAAKADERKNFQILVEKIMLQLHH